MQKYGKITKTECLISNHMLKGYKPIEYEKIPEDFNQQTHYAIQKGYEDKGEYIFIGIEIKGLDIDNKELEEDEHVNH